MCICIYNWYVCVSTRKDSFQSASVPCSDSGDSVFITQRAIPQAVRSGRRPSPHQRSCRSSLGFLRESDASSSDSSKESETKTKRVKKELPKYKFPFLCGQKWKPRDSLIAGDQNESLHVKMSQIYTFYFF